MPSLRESLISNLQGYEPVNQASPFVSPGSPPSDNKQPGLNPFLRCPIPPIWQTSPDTLRQFYQAGAVPQIRLFNPSTGTTVSGGVTNNYINVGNIGTGSSGSSGSKATAIRAMQSSIQTASLPPNGKFVKSIVLSKSFQLLNLSVGGASRVQLYGTAVAQSGDLSRGLDAPLSAGSIQNVIADIVLDTVPFQWTFQDRVGANGDSPQTGIVYITITNLAAANATLNATITYAPIVN